MTDTVPPEDQTLTWVAYLTWGMALVERLVSRGPSERMGWYVGLMLLFLLAMWRFMGSEGREQWPTWLLALVAPLALLVGGGGGAAALMVLAAAQIGYTIEGRRQWLQLGLANAILLGGMLSFWPLREALLNFVLFAGFEGFAVICMRFARRAELAAEAVRAVNAHLLATRSLLEESARDQERLRLSRELHDIAGHKLTALKINLQVYQRALPLPAELIDTAITISDELLRDIRGVVAQLRAHDGVDLGRALRQLAAQWPRPQVQIELDPDLRVHTVEQAEALLRVAQEGITNAARHGQATRVRIRLRSQDGGVMLEVEDDGRGLAAAQPHFGNGLTGMRERLQALGGELGIEAAVPHGLRLRARMPAERTA